MARTTGVSVSREHNFSYMPRPAWSERSITASAAGSECCSVSGPVDWSASEWVSKFRWRPADQPAEPWACRRSAGWSAWRSLSWTASVPEGCSARCCAWWAAPRGQLGTWTGPAEAACDWRSGPGSELAAEARRSLAAGGNLGGNQSQTG